MAYRLELPTELSQIHNIFHVFQLRKCVADETEVVPLEDIQVDEHLNYIERLIAILDRKVKVLMKKEVRLVQFSGSIGRDPTRHGSRSPRCESSTPSCF